MSETQDDGERGQARGRERRKTNDRQGKLRDPLTSPATCGGTPIALLRLICLSTHRPQTQIFPHRRFYVSMNRNGLHACIYVLFRTMLLKNHSPPSTSAMSSRSPILAASCRKLGVVFGHIPPCIGYGSYGDLCFDRNGPNRPHIAVCMYVHQPTK